MLSMGPKLKTCFMATRTHYWPFTLVLLECFQGPQGTWHCKRLKAEAAVRAHLPSRKPPSKYFPPNVKWCTLRLFAVLEIVFKTTASSYSSQFSWSGHLSSLWPPASLFPSPKIFYNISGTTDTTQAIATHSSRSLTRLHLLNPFSIFLTHSQVPEFSTEMTLRPWPLPSLILSYLPSWILDIYKNQCTAVKLCTSRCCLNCRYILFMYMPTILLTNQHSRLCPVFPLTASLPLLPTSRVYMFFFFFSFSTKPGSVLCSQNTTVSVIFQSLSFTSP